MHTYNTLSQNTVVVEYHLKLQIVHERFVQEHHTQAATFDSDGVRFVPTFDSMVSTLSQVSFSLPTCAVWDTSYGYGRPNSLKLSLESIC